MITHIKINNFKAFRKAEITTTSLNLFSGMNGMGKSSFIQSLLLLRQSKKFEELELKGELIDIGKGKDALNIHADSDYITFDVEEDGDLLLSLSYLFIAEDDLLLIGEREGDYVLTHDKKMFANCSLFNYNFKYLKAERAAPEHNYKANLNAVQKQNSLGYRGEHTSLYIALNKLEPLKINSVKHRDAKSNTLIAHIDAWMNEITPGTHVVSTYFPDLDIVRLAYQFENGNDVTPEFSPVNVGFGFTYTLPIITAILSAQKGDLVIIENPESHLHPQGQAKLGELFAKAANDGVQLIIESHSDHLLNGIRVAIKNKHIRNNDVSVFYFTRDKSANEHVTQIMQPKIDGNGRIDKWPDGFFDEWDKMLDELI